MEKYPPNIFENKDFLNQKLILDIEKRNEILVKVIMEYQDAIMNSRINIKKNEQQFINRFSENLQRHKEQLMIYLNEIEFALKQYTEKQHIGYIQQAKDLYKFLRKKAEELLLTKFNGVNKISRRILNLIEVNLNDLNNIK